MIRGALEFIHQILLKNIENGYEEFVRVGHKLSKIHKPYFVESTHEHVTEWTTYKMKHRPDMIQKLGIIIGSEDRIRPCRPEKDRLCLDVCRTHACSSGNHPS